MKKLLLLILGIFLSELTYPQITIRATVKGYGNKIIIGYWKDYTYLTDTLRLNMDKASLKLDSADPLYFKLYTIEPDSNTPFFIAFPGEIITIEKDRNHLTIKGGAEKYNEFLMQSHAAMLAEFAGKPADDRLTQFMLDRSVEFFSGFNHPHKQIIQDMHNLSVITDYKLYRDMVKYNDNTEKMDSLFSYIKNPARDMPKNGILKYLDKVNFNNPNISAVNTPQIMLMNNFIRIFRTQAVKKDSTLENIDEYIIENKIIKDLFKESRYRSRLLAYNLYHRINSYTEYPMQLAEVGDFIAEFRKEKFIDDLLPVIEKLYSRQVSTIGSLKKGVIAPAFKLIDTKGKTVTLSDFKGKVVYIDMWASWCGPCLKEMPYMEALKKKFSNMPVEMIAISIDTDKGKWLAKIASMKLGGVQLIDYKGSENSKIAKDYKIHGVPHYVLIDKNGRIASAFAPRPSSEVEIEKEINQLLQ
jgi:thiol-disulfide isomerase/thioredoxin